MDWQLSKRVMSQIWLKVREDSRNILDSCLVLAQNSLSKYGYFFFLILKIWWLLWIFFPKKSFEQFALDFCFGHHSVQICQKKYTGCELTINQSCKILSIPRKHTLVLKRCRSKASGYFVCYPPPHNGPRVNKQPPAHHEGWMVGGQETLFHWIPVQ